METKLSKLKDFINNNDWPSAIKLAASFPVLGKERDAILSAREGLLRPQFMKQIRRDPEALIEKGKQAIIQKYHLQG